MRTLDRPGSADHSQKINCEHDKSAACIYLDHNGRRADASGAHRAWRRRPPA
jgi:hypothetical protein